MLRRLEGSEQIPRIQDDQGEEEINSKDWIIRQAFRARVDLVDDIDYESAGTEQISMRIKV
jgi:hypothetical protein